MSVPSPTELLTFLQEHGFLTLSQVQGLGGGSATKFADSRALARELVDRNWLTAYQANQLLQGRGGELLLGPYRLLDRLGEGGMRQVFKAYHVSMDRIVALKIIPKDRVSNPVAVGRFYREVRAVAKLSHPNIVIALDVSQVGQTHFLAMEYMDGIDLAKLVHQSGRLPIAQACEYIRQAALGLQHAHEKGLVHRDIKPGNLIVARPHPDEPAVIKILDFGLARIESESTQAGRFTQLGSIVGTVDYIAPEQVESARTADIRADIYSLGCSLFYLLTGQSPFPGEDAVEKISARVLGDAPPVRKSRPDVPEGLEQVVGKMLARDPAKRFQTPAEVVPALEPFSKEGTVKAGTPDSVSGKTAVTDEDSGKIVAAAKKRARPVGPNPFATLEKDDKTSQKRSSPDLDVAKPKAKAASGNKGLMLGVTIGSGLAIGGGVAAILAVVLVIVLSRGGGGNKYSGLIVKNDDGKTTKGKDQNPARDNPPDTDKNNTKKDGPEKIDEEPKKDGPKTMPPDTDPDRRAAEWVLSIGGIIGIKKDAGEVHIEAVGGLPVGAFELTFVRLSGNPKVSDAGLARFKDCKNLTQLLLNNTQVGDAGLAHFKDWKNVTTLNLARTQVSDAGLAQGERIKLHRNCCGDLDSDKCTALRFSGLSPPIRRNAWSLLLPWARSGSTFAR
jgi:serine/threonine protein kinase